MELPDVLQRQIYGGQAEQSKELYFMLKRLILALLCFSFRDFMVDEEGRGTTVFRENNEERARNPSKQGLTASFNLFLQYSYTLHIFYVQVMGSLLPVVLTFKMYPF